MRVVLSIIFIISQLSSIGQIVTDTSSTPTDLVNNVLLGGNVVASSITHTGVTENIGEFSGNHGLPITNGIMLTTGTAVTHSGGFPNWNGPLGNNDRNVHYDNLAPGDPLLESIVGEPTHNASVLEFDFVPTGSRIEFNYVFASEEYPEFVCSNYNDIFGFFVSGDNPLGGSYVNENIARVPGSNDIVSVNFINNGVHGTAYPNAPCGSLTNDQYFVGNGDGSVWLSPDETSTSNVFNGWTVTLTASLDVVCGQSYHIKLAITDVSDTQYDSAVFLEAGSFNGVGTPEPINTSICYGESSTLTTTTPGITYDWFDAETGGNLLGTGTTFTTTNLTTNSSFWINYPPSANCVAPAQEAQVIVHPNPNDPTVGITQFCENEILDINCSNCDVNTTWFSDNLGTVAIGSGSSQTLSVVGSGNIYLQNVTSFGCLSPIISVPYEVFSTPDAAFNTSDLCLGEDLNLSISEPFDSTNDYTWTINGTDYNEYNPSITSSSIGTIPISLSINSSENCSNQSQTTITINDLPSNPSVSDTEFCSNENLDLTCTTCGSNSAWYEDILGSNQIGTGTSYSLTPISTGSVYVQNETNFGCLSPIVEIPFMINDTPDATFTTNDICAGENFNLFPSESENASYTYLWTIDGINHTGYNPQILSNLNGTSTIGLNINTPENCEDQTSETITIGGNLDYDAYVENNVGTISLLVDFNVSFLDNYTILWDFNNHGTSDEFNVTMEYSEAGEYQAILYVSDEIGCLDSVNFSIIAEGESSIIIPDIFTPNGDGINDNFSPITENINSLKLDIYNRWGTYINSIYGPKASWDGRNQSGSICSEGTYYFVLTAIGLDGTNYEEQSYFNLLK